MESGPGRSANLLVVIAAALMAVVSMSARAQSLDPQAQADALALLQRFAESGNRQAQYQLGGLYAQGDWVQQDDEVAAAWWRKAAEQGLAEAQNELGVVLAAGRGVELDPEQAVEWYRKAAEQGLAVAQANLGTMYWDGTGVRKSRPQAIQWYRKAADQGFTWAQFFIGEAYFTGVGLPLDRKQAAQWYRKAAEQDHTEAQYRLGAYLSGRAVAVRGDHSREAYAAYWVARAAVSGHEPAGQQLGRIYSTVRKIELPATIAVRAQPDFTADVIRNTGERERAGVLPEPDGAGRLQGWVAVYLREGHTVGFIRAEDARRR
jgi:TPR repeat protein